MKYINQRMYVEKYETIQVPINKELVDYLRDKLSDYDEIDINLIDEALVDYYYNKDTKSQLNEKQLLLIENGEIEWYQESIGDVIDEYILDNGREVGWSRLQNNEITEEWITRN